MKRRSILAASYHNSCDRTFETRYLSEKVGEHSVVPESLAVRRPLAQPASHPRTNSMARRSKRSNAKPMSVLSSHSQSRTTATAGKQGSTVGNVWQQPPSAEQAGSPPTSPVGGPANGGSGKLSPASQPFHPAGPTNYVAAPPQQTVAESTVAVDWSSSSSLFSAPPEVTCGSGSGDYERRVNEAGAYFWPPNAGLEMLEIFQPQIAHPPAPETDGRAASYVPSCA